MNAADFFARSSGVVLLECVELVHPAFLSTYRVVRNHGAGVTVRHEDEVQYTYSYYPLRIDRGNSSDDLDQTIKFTLADMGAELPADIDRVRAAGNTRPVVNYRVYASNNLNAPLASVLGLPVSQMACDATGAATFTAAAAELNKTRTGLTYTFEQFPMLRGYL